MKEGYYKFTAVRSGMLHLAGAEIEGLNAWRGRLRELGMVGVFETGELAGVGFGNLSRRTGPGFLITATRTGPILALAPRDYCEVVSVEMERNRVSFLSMDPGVTPSSECMTHAALYAADALIGAVMHVHHPVLWNRLLDRYPTTARSVEYGTPAMGRELARLFVESELPRRRVAVMGGHEDGVIVFGRDVDEAGRILIDVYERETASRG